jgi:hypothetical protein
MNRLRPWLDRLQRVIYRDDIAGACADAPGEAGCAVLRFAPVAIAARP